MGTSQHLFKLENFARFKLDPRQSAFTWNDLSWSRLKSHYSCCSCFVDCETGHQIALQSHLLAKRSKRSDVNVAWGCVGRGSCGGKRVMFRIDQTIASANTTPSSQRSCYLISLPAKWCLARFTLQWYESDKNDAAIMTSFVTAKWSHISWEMRAFPQKTCKAVESKWFNGNYDDV